MCGLICFQLFEILIKFRIMSPQNFSQNGFEVANNKDLQKWVAFLGANKVLQKNFNLFL